MPRRVRRGTLEALIGRVGLADLPGRLCLIFIDQGGSGWGVSFLSEFLRRGVAPYRMGRASRYTVPGGIFNMGTPSFK